jgi:hypothetical protein
MSPEKQLKVHFGPNFVGLRDQEQDALKLFKKYHVDGDDKRASTTLTVVGERTAAT